MNAFFLYFCSFLFCSYSVCGSFGLFVRFILLIAIFGDFDLKPIVVFFPHSFSRQAVCESETGHEKTKNRNVVTKKMNCFCHLTNDDCKWFKQKRRHCNVFTSNLFANNSEWLVAPAMIFRKCRLSVYGLLQSTTPLQVAKNERRVEQKHIEIWWTTIKTRFINW